MKNLLIILLCAFFGCNKNPVDVVHVKDFGATPNDSTCDARAIQDAFDYAKANGIKTVKFDAGDYDLQDSVFHPNDFEDERFLSYLLVQDFPGLTVLGATDPHGNPATRLVRYNPSLNNTLLPGHLQFDDCPDLTVKNLVFDNKPQYASAGEVMMISGDSVYVKIFEGLPKKNGMAAYCMNVWDLKTRDLKHQESLTYGTKKEIDRKNAYWFAAPEKGKNTMMISSPFIAERVEAGDGLSWHFGAVTAFQLAINRCNNLVLENILMPNISGFGIQTSACKNIKGKNVVFKSINNQLAVGPRDGWKVHMGDGIVEVDSMYVEGVRWDGQNVHGAFLVFKEKISDTKFRAWKKYSTLRPFEHDSIGFWIGDQEHTRFVNDYTIEQQTNKECIVTIEISEPLPPELKPETYISVHRWDNDHYILRNSTFRNIAGCGSIIKNRKVTLINNTYDNIMYPALALGGELTHHYEGTFPEDVLIEDCTFSRSGWVSRIGTKGLVGIGNAGYDEKVIGSVRFTGCTFQNGEVGIDILSAKEIILDQCVFEEVKTPYRVKDQTTLVSYQPFDNDLASTPPMGWNSWNWFGKHAINEENMKQCMDAMVEEGLLDAGYEYFVVDGGWRDTKLGPNGELLSHPKKFPNGMKALADYAHSKGLKFGLHTVPGTHDCGGDPVGGFGHEEVQVKQFADWGIDFIKLDKCKHAEGWNEDLLKTTYEKWHRLLGNCGRDIVLSVSAYQFRDWNPEVCQMSRTTLDIGAKVSGGARFDYDQKAKNFLSVMAIAEQNNEFAKYAAPGYWNDPDMLVVGDHGLTIGEQKTHFALWCIMSSPLMLGNDPRNMTSKEKDIILNKLAISINQDATEQGKRVNSDGTSEIWAKKLEDGKVAVLLLNRDREKRKNIILPLADLGFSGDVKVQDVWSGEKLGSFSTTFSKEIEPHAGSFLLLGTE